MHMLFIEGVFPKETHETVGYVDRKILLAGFINEHWSRPPGKLEG